MYEDDYIDTADMWRMEQEAREADMVMYVCHYADPYAEDEEEQ